MLEIRNLFSRNNVVKAPKYYTKYGTLVGVGKNNGLRVYRFDLNNRTTFTTLDKFDKLRKVIQKNVFYSDKYRSHKTMIFKFIKSKNPIPKLLYRFKKY